MIQYEGESYIELAEIDDNGIVHQAIELPRLFVNEGPQSLHGKLTLLCGEIINVIQYQNNNWHCFLGKKDQISCIWCKEKFLICH